MTRPLLDPFAGSGTIPIEAALMARRIPPGWQRTFAFEEWPGFDPALWSKVRARAEAGILPRAPGPILGSDRDAGAITMASANAERAGVGADIEWTHAAFSMAIRPEAPAWIVANPPYGVRVGDANKLRDLYRGAGRRGFPAGRRHGTRLRGGAAVPEWRNSGPSGGKAARGFGVKP
jgi:putative N6-adenine-specific DNA methylase